MATITTMPKPRRDSASPRRDVTTAAVLDAAQKLADTIKADSILVVANRKVDRNWLQRACDEHSVVLALQSRRWTNIYQQEGYSSMQHSSPPLDRFSRIAHATISAISEGLIGHRGRVVSVTGPIGGDALDSITVVKASSLFRELATLERDSDRKVEVLPVIKATIDIALELGAYGIEGRPVGTMFVVGDTASVLKLSRQGTFNPFRGYSEKQKNILNPDLRESVKAFAQIDGAYIIREDGTINAAGRLLLMPKGTAPILKGMGARHNAAAFMTRETSAVAIVVSQTTGAVSVISRGRILFTLSPASRTAIALYAEE
ncbi:MAG: DNA integrity scanning protein DisA nucleotide-binding domain protein [Planctomycetes bacterium]|nr:DNA integrity scanning protein DisA nucleotide-binding domain protein [Planctomycetota bacterium]